MIVQKASVDISMWEPDAEFEIYPQGARSKSATIAPDEPSDPAIRGGRRYMFKLSRASYPDQFWGEVVAYRVGCLLQVSVPPAFAAWNAATGQCGALIEWFYEVGTERFVQAGEFLQVLQPDFERRRGESHCTRENEVLMRALSTRKILLGDWREWWVHALAFDTLIGNSDRHQDNWGFIYQAQPALNKCWLAPMFDNGTSLGSELFTDRVVDWTDQRLEQYINRGTHHVRWRLDDGSVDRKHFSLLTRALEHWPETRSLLRDRVRAISGDALRASLQGLTLYQLPVPFSDARRALSFRLLSRRLER